MKRFFLLFGALTGSLGLFGSECSESVLPQPPVTQSSSISGPGPGPRPLTDEEAEALSGGIPGLQIGEVYWYRNRPIVIHSVPVPRQGRNFTWVEVRVNGAIPTVMGQEFRPVLQTYEGDLSKEVGEFPNTLTPADGHLRVSLGRPPWEYPFHPRPWDVCLYSNEYPVLILYNGYWNSQRWAVQRPIRVDGSLGEIEVVPLRHKKRHRLYTKAQVYVHWDRPGIAPAFRNPFGLEVGQIYVQGEEEGNHRRPVVVTGARPSADRFGSLRWNLRSIDEQNRVKGKHRKGVVAPAILRRLIPYPGLEELRIQRLGLPGTIETQSVAVYPGTLLVDRLPGARPEDKKYLLVAGFALAPQAPAGELTGATLLVRPIRAGFQEPLEYRTWDPYRYQTVIRPSWVTDVIMQRPKPR